MYDSLPPPSSTPKLFILPLFVLPLPVQVPLREDGAAGGPGPGSALSALPLLQRLVPRVQAALTQLGPTFLAPICRREELSAEQVGAEGGRACGDGGRGGELRLR